jgi:cytochrome c-type biogenesis protein CcmF
VKVSVGAPFFNQVNVPVFLGLIFLMGVGPLIAWRRASRDNLRRNFLWPLVIGLVSAALFFGLGVRSALAVLSLALTVFVAAAIGVDYVRATRARLRMGDRLLPALGGLLVRHNRRYGGFAIHFGILIIVVGITGSQAWSVQREATVKRGEAVELAGYTFRFDRLEGRDAGNHFLVESTFKITNGKAVAHELRPAKKFYPQEQSPIAHVDYRLGWIDDLYMVLGDFARDGTQATVKVQVNRMVSWIWIGGLVLTLGTILAILPERKKPA